MDSTHFRFDTPLVGVPPFGQVHAHSTANSGSTAENEATFMSHKNLEGGYFTHVVGNGKIFQTCPTNRGTWDVGGGWNSWGYASVELIESHKTKAEFMIDYKLYVNLLRELAVEAGVPITLDTSKYGIVTHQYCTNNQPDNESNHVDPYPYLAKWGISKSQFQHDIANGMNTEVKPKTNISNVVQVLDSKSFKTFTTYNGAGKANVGSWITPNSKWISNEIKIINNNPYYKIGSDIYLPQSSTTMAGKVVINSDVSIDSIDKNGKANGKLNGGSDWKYSALVNIANVGWCYQIATDMFLPIKFNIGSGYKGN